MIQSFADGATEDFFKHGLCPAQWRAFAKVARRKLDMLDAAVRLENLRSPPGNRLEALRHDRQGQWSIRINDQWRICFQWTAKGPADVEIVDYH
jgi:proteic killer suppression protein